MFIEVNKNNEIIASADFKFSENCIETNRKIVRNWDGKLVFEGEETEVPQPTLEELKQEKIKELKQKRDEYKKTIFIKDGYTLDDFKINSNDYANLIRLKHGWAQEDLNKFDFETDKMVKKYDYYKNKISEAQSAAELNSINIEFYNLLV